MKQSLGLETSSKQHVFILQWKGKDLWACARVSWYRDYKKVIENGSWCLHRESELADLGSSSW